MIFGPQGAGKSTHALALAKTTGGVRFSIDEWMGELYGNDAPQTLNIDWVMERVHRCERRIWATAAEIARNGGVAILDLGFTKIASRHATRALAEAEALEIDSHYVTAPHDVRRSRVLARNQGKGATFAFEVTPMMFDFMEKEFEPATSSELQSCNVIGPTPDGP